MKSNPEPAARWFKWSLVLAIVAAGDLSGRMAPQVIAIGDVTTEGRKLPVPTEEAPVYYHPVVAGHRKLGAVMAGDKPPAQDEVMRTLTQALAKDHYHLAPAGETPDLLLVFWWGSMNPQIDEMEQNEDEAAPTQVFFNQRGMLSLVGALKANAFRDNDPDQLRAAAEDDRYFVLVAAFDFAAAKRQEKKLLWMARMSTESTGRSPDEAFPALAASGGLVFGRDTRPAWIDSGKLRQGTIEMGEPQVKEYLPPEKQK